LFTAGAYGTTLGDLNFIPMALRIHGVVVAVARRIVHCFVEILHVLALSSHIKIIGSSFISHRGRVRLQPSLNFSHLKLF
jgi:hypothetical protein